MAINTKQMDLSKVLKQNTSLKAFELKGEKAFSQLISETNKKQDAILKLKEVKQESLRTVVQF